MLTNVFRSLSVFVVGLALLPLLSLPFEPVLYVQQDLQKTLVAVLLLGLALVGAGVALWRSGERMTFQLPAVAYAASLLGILGVASALVNGLSLTKFFGSGFAVGTGGSFLLFAAVVIAASLVPLEYIRTHYKVYIGSMLLTTLLLAILLPLGPALLEWVPIKSTLNFPVPYLLATAILASAIFGDALGGRPRLYFALATLVLLTGFVFGHVAFSTLVLLGLLSLYIVVRGMRVRALREVPWISIAVAVLLAALLLIGFKGPGTSAAFLLSTQASHESTQLVVNSVLAKDPRSALLGTGPDTFSANWELYRTKELNQEGERMDPRGVAYGSTSLLTWVTSVGLLGAGAYVLCFMLLIGGIGLALARARFELLANPLFAVPALVALLGLVASATETIGPIQFLLTAVALGFSGALLLDAAPQTRPVSWRDKLLATVALCMGLLLIVLSVAQLVARSYYHRAEYTTDARASERYAIRAAALWPLSTYIQKSTSAFTTLNFTAEYSEQQLLQRLVQIEAYADRGIQADPTDFRAWVSKAKVLMAYLPLETANVRPAINESLERAAALAPRRPDILVLQARLALSVSNTARANALIDEALQLVPEYPDALALRAEIEAKSSSAPRQ